MGSTISSLLSAAEQGTGATTEMLFDALYAELHRLAKRELARHVPMSLGATTLLHTAYLDMAARSGPDFPDRARFMTYAARVMRGLIIDHSRSRRAQKRGGHFEITSFDVEAAAVAVDNQELSNISDALDELAKTDPALAGIVDLKFFCGFSFRGNRSHKVRLGTYRSEAVGESADLSPPQHSRALPVREPCRRPDQTGGTKSARIWKKHSR